MSSFVWMKYLESTPERYDRGIERLTKGRIADVYERIADIAAEPGARVLDVGCGTGGVTLACAARGAHVIAIDTNVGMLDMARAKPASREYADRIEWLELGLAEIEDRVGEAGVDAMTFCLVFSELSPDEQAYALDLARTRLTPHGHLVIADETLPGSRFDRLRYNVCRLPRAAAVYALTQTSTRPVDHLADRVRAAGFRHVAEIRPWRDTFVIVHALPE